MRETSVRLAKLSVAGLLVGTILMQILLPVLAHQTGTAFPEVQDLVVPYAAAAVVTVLSIQVALAAVYGLISAIPRGEFFGARSATLIDVIRTALATAAAVPAVIAAHLLFFVGVGGPGVVLVLAASCVIGVALTVLIGLGKRLFLDARSEHEELGSVI